MATEQEKIGKEHVEQIEDELDSQYTGRNIPVASQSASRIAAFAEATGMSPKIISSAMLDLGAGAPVEDLLARVTVVITNRALRLKN